MKISKKKIIQIEETLKDFKDLIPRFKEIMGHYKYFIF